MDLPKEYRSNMAMELENAVINNCAKDIFELESEGADVFRSTQSGESLLHLAARNGSNCSIAALHVLNADPDVVNSSNVTPLEVAVRWNHGSSVKALLKAGAKLDKKLIQGDTYLHIAASGGNIRALETLLEGGVDVNDKNQHSETAIVEAIELLLKRGVDCSAISGLRLSNDDSIAHSLARSGNTKLFELLKDKITANITNQSDLTPLHVTSDLSVVRILLRMGVDVDAQDNTGSTPLMIAAKNCKPEIVRSLLLSGANPLIKDNKGRNALHYAAEGGCTGSVTTLLGAGLVVDQLDNNLNTPAFTAVLYNKSAVLKLLVENGANLTLRDCDGNGILHREASRGHVQVVKALLDFGIAVNMEGKNQWTALHYAARKGRTAVVTELLKAGAAVDVKNNNQNTALFLAVLEGHTPVITSLLKAGAAVNIKNKKMNTALHFAAIQDRISVVKLLLKAGAAINIQNIDKYTPLHWACWYGYTRIVKTLLDHRADVSLTNTFGWSPLFEAILMGHFDIVELLQDHGTGIDLRNDRFDPLLNWAETRADPVMTQYLRTTGKSVRLRLLDL